MNIFSAIRYVVILSFFILLVGCDGPPVKNKIQTSKGTSETIIEIEKTEGATVTNESPPVVVFRDIPAGRERKQAFFAYFIPLITEENAKIIKDRSRLQAFEGNPRSEEAAWVEDLAKRYKMGAFDVKKKDKSFFLI